MKNNGTSACASCKHQRKKCSEKCILAPLFPGEKTNEFKAVHKLFGVSNLIKLVERLPQGDDRISAARSLIWEAMWRNQDPILGAYGEYKRMYDELRLYKMQFGNMYQNKNVSCQGDMTTMYKPHAPTIGDLGGWNNSIGNINHSSNFINNDIGNVVNIGPNCFDYFTQREDELIMEKSKQEVMNNVVYGHHQDRGFNY